MSGFNTSSRRSEDVSLKLRAQDSAGTGKVRDIKEKNLRNAKNQTKRLEEENIKMEERLRELKLAMSREKEEREKKGGGFWSKGQTGVLSNYAGEVLEKSKSRKKEKGFKILKNEPIVLPERSSEPGTLKYIAQRPLNGKENKPKGLKCGQCEERSASLACLQCSEHYCTRCFAAFHIKGALKKHRSIPVTAMGPRQSMSPRPLNSYREYDSARDVSVVGAMSSSIDNEESDPDGPEGASGSYDRPSLMAGRYDEAESAASFQQALSAWRSGEKSPGQKMSENKELSSRNSAKNPVFSTESSTSTTAVIVSPEIHFHSKLTYAERLLLKTHRRTEIPSLGSVTPTSGRQSSFSRRDDDDNDDDLDGEPVSFTALYEASVNVQSPRQPARVDSDISMIELDSNSAYKDHHSMKIIDPYEVKEVEPYEAWEVENLNKVLSEATQQETPLAAKPPPSRGYNKKQSRKSAEPKNQTSDSTETDHSSTNQNHENKKYKTTSSKRNISSRQGSGDGDVKMDFVGDNEAEPELQFSQPKSRCASARSVRSRPSSARAKSSKSRMSSRPSSRAKSRIGEGVLTKGPNELLREVASRLSHTETNAYKSPMENFFTMGVEKEFQERTMTPSKNKKAKEDSFKVSNRLYQMAPCSWKPDNSLENHLPSDTVVLDNSEFLSQFVGSEELNEEALRAERSGMSRGDTLKVEKEQDDITRSKMSRSEVYQDEIARPTSSQSDMYGDDTPRNEISRNGTPRNEISRNGTPRNEISRNGTPRNEISRHGTPRNEISRNGTSRSEISRNETLRNEISRNSTPTNEISRNSTPTNEMFRSGTPRNETSRNSTSRNGMSRNATPRNETSINKTPRNKRSKTEITRREIPRNERSKTEIPSDENSESEFYYVSGNEETRSITPRNVTPKWPSPPPVPRQDSAHFKRPISQTEQVRYDTPDTERTPRGKTPRQNNNGRPVSKQGSRPSSRFAGDGRTSRAIVVDGEDMSKYDDVYCNEIQEKEDNETLEKLEWELASESGRLTADGQISRISLNDDVFSLSGSSQGSTPTGQFKTDQSFDLNSKLRMDELSDDTDENDNKVVDTEDVKALH